MSTLNTLRMATQIRELSLQGITIKNTFKEMEDVWLELHTEDKRCPIVEQSGTKVKYQLVNLYAYKLIKYLNSIVGMDMVPLSQQDADTQTWKMDTIILNVAGNRVKDHEHLFRTLLVNLFGVSEDLVAIAFAPTAENIRTYIKKTYDVDLGETDGVGEITLEQAEQALEDFLAGDTQRYKLY